MSGREFNQHASEAKRAAARGPVYITDRGRPAHVLITFEAYERLLGTQQVIDRLGEPVGVEDIDFSVPAAQDVALPATFD